MRWAAALLLVLVVLAGCLSGGSPGSSSSASTAGHPGSTSRSSSSASHAPVHPASGNSSANATTPANQSAPSANASAPRTWATLDAATIRPGAAVNGGDCTANFVFTSPDNSTVYIGTAAHCFSSDLNTQTDGCQANVEPLGAKRSIEGASKPAVLAYSSWLSMQAHNETSSLCVENDLALLRLDPADYAKVNPAMQQYGGPTGLASSSDLHTGDRILSYGNSGTRPEDSQLSPREGVVSLPASGCDTRVTFPNPAIPGDSGSPVILSDGRAIGDFVSIELYPITGQGHVCLLDEMLDYAHSVGFDARLATWDLLDGGVPAP